MRPARGSLVSALLVLTAGWVGASAPVDAAVVTPVSGLTSATNGIALGSDGNLWVAEEFAGSVAKVSPTGTVLGHVNLGGNPTSVTTGPNGTVWVTDPSQKKVFRIEVADSSHTETDVSGLATCEPIGIVDGGDTYMYLSFPACGKIGRIPVLGGAGGVRVASVTPTTSSSPVESSSSPTRQGTPCAGWLSARRSRSRRRSARSAGPAGSPPSAALST